MTCAYRSIVLFHTLSWTTCISSDYRNVDPRYGSLDDWDRLVKAMHERGLKMM